MSCATLENAKSAAKNPGAIAHPKVSEMVNEAISALHERGGSSLHAVKKYIESHHEVDLERLTPFIKKYLKSAVASGALIQTKGKGARGSFKLGASGQNSKEPTKAENPVKEGSSPRNAAKEPAGERKATEPKSRKTAGKRTKRVSESKENGDSRKGRNRELLKDIDGPRWMMEWFRKYGNSDCFGPEWMVDWFRTRMNLPWFGPELMKDSFRTYFGPERFRAGVNSD